MCTGTYWARIQDNRWLTGKANGHLDHVTTMLAVSAAGQIFKRVVGFLVNQIHYRTVNGCSQSSQEFFPPCYVHMREISGVNTPIFQSWLK